MERETMIVGDYVLTSKLGEGSFSTVWKGHHRIGGDAVAVKQVLLFNLNRHLKSCLDCELNFLSSVNHPNIIRLIDVFEAQCCIFLVLEFCAGGNLACFIQRHGRVQEQTARRFIRQLGAAMEILHSNHIVHRDLKPENILISGSEENAVLKIADFGLSRNVHPGESVETVCGTPFYMAPELLQFCRYDEKVDMWSIGAILFELLNGYPPFHGRSNVQIILAGLHPDCIDICSRLLSLDPVDRLSFEEFYWHNFLRKI